jgi:hypothetical protein
MKYIITESKLDTVVTNYLDELFDLENINHTNPEEWDDESGESWEDPNRVMFYIGDYSDEDEGCFYWFGCDYFYPFSPASEKCPMVNINSEYENKLTGFFGDMWHEPFKRWFTDNFGLPIKTID